MADSDITRRGVLSIVSSLLNPLGLVAPVTVQGRALLQDLSMGTCDWDIPLLEDRITEWQMWRDSLQDLRQLHIPHPYIETSLSKLCLFLDASTKAIGAVAYLRVTDEDGQIHVGFVMGKAKLAPLSEPTIPQLELCGAVLAVEMKELILEEIDLEPDNVKFYCDSKVILGCIYNKAKRFYVYVHNQIQHIRQSMKPEQ